jgi:hypothetical protein
MPIIEGHLGVMQLVPRARRVAGTDEVQTLTIGGTPTGGTFKLAFDGRRRPRSRGPRRTQHAVANIDAALEALTNIGTGGVTTAVGTMTAASAPSRSRSRAT